MREITEGGLEKLKKELVHLKTEKRKEVASKLKHAISFGDLSENAAYDEAKEDQAFVEGRIKDLESLIREASVVNRSRSSGVARVGSSVTIDIEGECELFIIVGAAEADPMENKISDSSPLGKAIVGKKKGDLFIFNSPDGEKKKYKVIEVK